MELKATLTQTKIKGTCGYENKLVQFLKRLLIATMHYKKLFLAVLRKSGKVRDCLTVNFNGFDRSR